jgi:DNA-binding transcriptional LysR family regulator
VVPESEIARHVQLVLTDPTQLSQGRDFGVLSAKTWRLSDLGSKHAFLKAGFGWGQMPLHLVDADIRAGRLVKIKVEGAPTRTQVLTMRAVHRKASSVVSRVPEPRPRWPADRQRAAMHGHGRARALDAC